MFRFVVLLVAVAAANAQYIAPAIAHQDSNIYRSYGNLGQVSTFSKSVSTPFSSVHKADVRVSNPGYAVASPLIGHGYASPISHGYAAPIAHGYAAPISHGYVAPSYAHSPVVAPYAYNHGAYGAPVAKVAGAGLLGVAYSVAPAVSHMTYSNGLGVNYAW